MNKRHGHCVESLALVSEVWDSCEGRAWGAERCAHGHPSSRHDATSPVISERFLVLPIPCALNHICSGGWEGERRPCVRALQAVTPHTCVLCHRYDSPIWGKACLFFHSRRTSFRSASIGPPILCQTLCQMTWH